MPTIDPKLARGLARVAGRDLDRGGARARSEDFHFALELVMRRDLRGRRIGAPTFNVPLARVLKEAAANPATLRAESVRMRLGTPGVLHRQSLAREEVLHFRGGGREHAEREWAILVDHVRVDRGSPSCMFWTPPVLFGHHLVERWIERAGDERAARVAALLDGTLPLAAVWLSAAARAGGGSVFAFDVALPAPGGALLGGIEIVSCPPLTERFRSGPGADGETDIHCILDPVHLTPVVSVRTYVDDALLGPGQRRAVAAVADWWSSNSAAIRGDPLAAYGWTDTEGWRQPDSGMVDSFAAAAEGIQRNFQSWRRTLVDEGYFDVDFASLRGRFATTPPEGGKMDPGMLARHMRVELRGGG